MRWQRNAPSWQARYVMKLARPGQPDRIVPWLNALTIGGQWGVGCTARAIAKLPGAYVGFSIRTVGALQNRNLKKHDMSACHIKAPKHMADAARTKVCLAPDVAKLYTRFFIVNSAQESMLAAMKDLFPDGADWSRASYWAGLRPMTPEGTPILGPSRMKNLWFNTGQGHMGWTMSHGAARITADLIAGQRPAIALDGMLAAT
jgi:hypothetical protein